MLRDKHLITSLNFRNFVYQKKRSFIKPYIKWHPLPRVNLFENYVVRHPRLKSTYQLKLLGLSLYEYQLYSILALQLMHSSHHSFVLILILYFCPIRHPLLHTTTRKPCTLISSSTIVCSIVSSLLNLSSQISPAIVPRERSKLSLSAD